jgi:cytochrome c553
LEWEIMRTIHAAPAAAAFAVTIAILFAATPAVAQSANNTRSLAATCTACHGTDGVSVGNVPPGLAGQNKDYLLLQLKDFKAGKRPATIMHQHAKGYSDEQLERIAAYFAAVKPGEAAAAPRAGN